MRCGWCTSDRLLHLSSELFYLLTPEFRSSLHFYCLLLAICLQPCSVFMLLMSFSRHWKALWVTLRWVFRRHTNKKKKLSQTHGWEFRLRGFERKKKKERCIIRCCVRWAGDLWFFRKSSSDKRDAFDADFRISLNSVSRTWRLKQKRQTD